MLSWSALTSDVAQRILTWIDRRVVQIQPRWLNVPTFKYKMRTMQQLALHLPRTQTTIFSSEPRLHNPLFVDEQRSSLCHLQVRSPASAAMSGLDSDSPLLRPGAVARTPFGTPFFALFTNPDIDAPELGKLRLSVKLREELAAWEKLQRTGKGKGPPADNTTSSASAAEQLQDDSPTRSFARDAPGAGTARRSRVGPSYFEFVDDDDDGGDGGGSGEEDTAAERWPDTYYTGDDNEDVDCEVDGFVFIHRAHATGSVFWNHVRPRPSSGPRGRARQRRHRKGAEAQYDLQYQVERVEEEELTALWSYVLDLLRPVGEMDW